MRASDVVEQLTRELPKRTNLFSEEVSVSSLTYSGTTATATTAAAHGFSDNDKIVIKGAKEVNSVTSLTFADGTVSAETANDHKLTKPTAHMIAFPDRLDSYNYASISGANESEYNGTHLLTEVPNRRSFQYEIEGTPASPATGSPILEQETVYNGTYQITVTGANSFTYPLPAAPASNAIGTITAQGSHRISSAVTLAMFLRAITRQQESKYWACVVLGDVTASKDRNILGDATYTESKQSEFRCRLIEPFRVFIVAPMKQTYSGRPIEDKMETVRAYVYNSLLGWIFPSALSETPFVKTSPVGDRYVPESSNDAMYIHEFMFERTVDVTYPDTVGPPASVPFRDVFKETEYQFGTNRLESEVDLDEQPL